MRFGPSRGGYGNQPTNPFGTIEAAAGPGVGGAPTKLFTSPITKRRRFDNQQLGSTPPRDGPFASSAMGIAQATPPRARAQKRKKSNV